MLIYATLLVPAVVPALFAGLVNGTAKLLIPAAALPSMERACGK